MHELSIAQALVEQLTEIAAKEGAERVLRATVSVGHLSGVDAEALAFAFPLAAAATPAADARLDIEAVAAQLRCRRCGVTSEMEALLLMCPRCGSTDAEVSAGRELVLQSVDLNVPEGKG